MLGNIFETIYTVCLDYSYMIYKLNYHYKLYRYVRILIEIWILLIVKINVFQINQSNPYSSREISFHQYVQFSFFLSLFKLKLFQERKELKSITNHSLRNLL